MRENYPKAFNLTVMQFEGGSRFTQDADDPGGATKYGLSKKANPDLDIVNLTEQQAKEIYLQRYWTPSGCDEMPYPWDMVVFDTAVNLGVGRAAGLKTKAGTPCEFHMERIAYYCSLVDMKPIMQKYHRGWINRVNKLWQETKSGK
jgi:lysozyme family protein